MIAHEFLVNLLVSATFARLATSIPTGNGAGDDRRPAFFLAGDSTTATQSPGGGGWGDGFLNTTLQNGATGQNFGHNGATTVSFKAGGDWSRVLDAAAASLPSFSPYITIQFGHNDQKPEKNISSARLTANLIQYVTEARAVPATPILVTSLSRRRYQEVDGQERVVENLADVTAAAKQAAAESGCSIIDLNAASTEYLNAIGSANAYSYNLNPTDYTHLNSQGSVVFGNMVATLLQKSLSQTAGYVFAEDQIEEAIRDGRYYFPASCDGDFCGSPA